MTTQWLRAVCQRRMPLHLNASMWRVASTCRKSSWVACTRAIARAEEAPGESSSGDPADMKGGNIPAVRQRPECVATCCAQILVGRDELVRPTRPEGLLYAPRLSSGHGPCHTSVQGPSGLERALCLRLRLWHEGRLLQVASRSLARLANTRHRQSCWEGARRGSNPVRRLVTDPSCATRRGSAIRSSNPILCEGRGWQRIACRR